MTRERLPTRRPSETADLEFDGVRYAVTIGFFPDGRLGEAFAGNAKVGSGVEAILDDACILVSLLLQNGVEAAALAKTVGRLEGGKVPASIIGAICDTLVNWRAAEQENRGAIKR